MNDTGGHRTTSRALGVMFALVFSLTLVLLAQSWHASVLDRYEFRQLQTALSTWWIAQEGWQLDYLTPLFGPPWSIPMEFPTYQVMVAKFHTLTGYPLEQSGRLVAVAMLLMCLPALYDLLGIADLKPSRRLIVLAVLLSSPIYLFYARTFMIETTALCLSVWFLAMLRRSLEAPRALWIITATLVGTLAALTKITTFLVFGCPALALVMLSLRRPTRAFVPTLIASLVPATVALGVAWWWIQHGDAVKDSNPFTGFLAARELRAWNFGSWNLRFDSSFWIHLQENIVGYNLAEGAIAIALICTPFASSLRRRVAGVALLGFISGPLVFANLYHVHDYYYAANALLLLSAAGLMLASVWDDPRLPRGANWLALVLVLSFQWHAFYRGYYSHHRHPAPPAPELAQIIREAVPSDDVVLVYGADWNPLLPYYFQRRALMVPGGREHEMEVLDQVLAKLPPRRVAAMVISGDVLRARPDFVQERTKRFGLSPQPVVRYPQYDLYLPVALPDSVRAKVAGRAGPTAPPLLPADETFPSDLNSDAPIPDEPAIFSPSPIAIRSRYGVGAAEINGRRALNAHAPSELVFRPGPDARKLHAIFGIADGAFSAGSESITDGISAEIVIVTPAGEKQRLFHRLLDPARQPGDRGPQKVELDLPEPFSGELILRLGNGPAGNPTNDWAYWTDIRIN